MSNSNSGAADEGLTQPSMEEAGGPITGDATRSLQPNPVRPAAEGVTEQPGQAGDLALDGVKSAMDPASREATLGAVPDRAHFARASSPYKLLQRIGEGGMGEVWMAEQSEPVKRRVALKLIRKHLGSKEMLARFEIERQALAMMNHPNIARVLDIGTMPDGQPYMAMELVLGLQLAAYCDENRLSIDDRLRLFTDVCNGVHHAHQKGVVHRDLKPSNILVTVTDGKAIPKVIDFGLAKAIEHSQRLTDHSLFTGIGQILGTYKYMSPEQARLGNLDIDTRTDVYSLGVILYELLTGSTPLVDASIKGKPMLDVLQLIRDKEPIKPSDCLTSSTAEQQSSITGKRRTDSIRLNRILAGDLDWIVLKALEKDRARRYDSASDFAADIQRYLNGEPVVARPPSVSYRINKFVRRHRVGVMAALLVAFAFAGGIAGISLAMVRARNAELVAEQKMLEAVEARERETHQRKIAETRQQDAIEARDREAEQRAFAVRKQEEAEDAQRSAELAAERERTARMNEERERAFAEAISQFVKDDFLALTSVEGQDRFGGAGLDRNTTLYELLERAAIKLRARQDLAPMIEAELSWIVGVNFRAAGEPAQGIPFLQRSYELYLQELGPVDRLTLNSMISLAVAYNTAGEIDRALPLLERGLELRMSTYGPWDPETLKAMSLLGSTYLDRGQLDQALKLLNQSLATRLFTLGIDHVDTLTNMANLATAYRAAGKLDIAISLYERAYQRMLNTQGPQHPYTVGVMDRLAGAYRAASRLDEAIPLFEQALEFNRSRLGPSHPTTLSRMNNLGLAYADSGQLDRALPLLEQLVELSRSTLAPDHPETLNSIGSLASAYWRLNRFDRSIPLYEEILPAKANRWGRDHLQTQTTVGNLGVNYKDAGRIDEAIPLLEEAYESSRRFPNLAWVRAQLRDAYVRAGNVERFQVLAQEELKMAREDLPDPSSALAAVLVSIGEHSLRLTMFDEGAVLLREGLELRQQMMPDAWVTFHTQSLLGASLLGAANRVSDEEEKARLLAESEKWLIAGYEGLEARARSIPSRHAGCLLESLDRLAALYTALDRPDDVARYRQLRERHYAEMEKR